MMESTSVLGLDQGCDLDDVAVLVNHRPKRAAAKRQQKPEKEARHSRPATKRSKNSEEQEAVPSRSELNKLPSTSVEKEVEHPNKSNEDEAGPSQPVAKQPKKAGGEKKAQPKKPVAARTKTVKVSANKGRKTKSEKEEEEVNSLLILAGYKNPEKSSKCVRAGLIRGNFGFKFTGEAAQLDKVVLEAKCSTMEHVCDVDPKCTGTMKATVRQLLEQPDYAGYDYEDGLRNAKVECDTCKKNRSYLTRCCSSDKPVWDSGKFHNHCTRCKGLGVCIGDYRNTHCYRCGKHYFGGSMGNSSCKCASKGGRSKSKGCEFM